MKSGRQARGNEQDEKCPDSWNYPGDHQGTLTARVKRKKKLTPDFPEGTVVTRVKF